MADSFTDPSWVYSEPHPDAEFMAGHEATSNDVINRVPKRLYEDLRQLYADFYYQADLDGQEGGILEKPAELRTMFDGIRRTRGGVVSVYPEAVAWPIAIGYRAQVFVCGGGYGIHGSSGVTVTNNVRSYAVATDEWISRRAMPYGTVRGVGALYNAKAYIFGGRDDLIAARDTVQIYDLESDSWTLGTPMPGQRTNQAVAVIGTKIHLVGGFASSGSTTPTPFTQADDHWIYDPETDTWDESAAVYPISTSSAAGVGYNGKVYVFGGVDGGTDVSCYRYDPDADDWAALTDLPDGLAGGHSAVVAPGPNGITGIYIMGGSGVETVHVYQPDTNTYVGAANRPDDVPNSSASPYAIGSGLTYLDGRIWKVCGYNGNEDNPLDTMLGLSLAAPIFEADRTGVYALRSVGGDGAQLVNLTTHREGKMIGADAGDEIGVSVYPEWSSKAVSAQVIG